MHSMTAPRGQKRLRVGIFSLADRVGAWFPVEAGHDVLWNRNEVHCSDVLDAFVAPIFKWESDHWDLICHATISGRVVVGRGRDAELLEIQHTPDLPVRSVGPLARGNLIVGQRAQVLFEFEGTDEDPHVTLTAGWQRLGPARDKP